MLLVWFGSSHHACVAWCCGISFFGIANLALTTTPSDTGNPASTYKELAFWQTTIEAEKPDRLILINMLRDDERKHDHVSARALFGTNRSYIKWPLGDAGSKRHVPEKVVKQILSVLGIQYSPRPEVRVGHGAEDDGYEVPAEPSDYDTLESVSVALAASAEASPRGWEWLHGKMGNTAADKLCREAGNAEGTYFVREASGSVDTFVLTVVYRGKSTHHKISQNSATTYWQVGKESHGSHTTVSALINGLKNSPPPSWPVPLAKCVPSSVDGGVAPAQPGAVGALPKALASHNSGRKLSKDLASWGIDEVKQFLHEQGLGVFEETLQTIGVGSGKTLVKLKGEQFPPGEFSEDNLTNFDAAMFKLRTTSLRVDFTATDAATSSDVAKKLRDGITARQRRLMEDMKQDEEIYIKYLRQITDGFKRPLMASKALTKQDAEVVFMNVQDLLNVHEAFLSAVALLSATASKVLMSRPFLRHVKEMMRHYGRFSLSIVQATSTLERLAKGPLGRELERLRKLTGGKMLSLKRLLTIPAQHVRRYPRFLEKLLKALPDYHIDEQDLVRAKDAMDNLVVSIDSQQENRQELLAVAARLEGYPGRAPLQTYAPLLRDGDLLYVDSSTYSNGANPNKDGNESYVFLLQKAIVIASKSCGCTDASRCQHKCTYQVLHEINSAWTIVDVDMRTWPEASQHKTYRFGFGIKENGRVVHEFAAKSLPAKRKWKVALQKCLPTRERAGTRERAPSTPNQNTSAEYFTDGTDQPTTIVAKMMSIVVQDGPGVPMREGTGESFVGSYNDLGPEAIPAHAGPPRPSKGKPTRQFSETEGAPPVPRKQTPPGSVRNETPRATATLNGTGGGDSGEDLAC